MSGPVVLVGLMGSGKTTVGRRLAARLDRPFADADEALEERTGRTVAEIFETDGEDGFRDIESELLGDLLTSTSPLVVAAGGGVVLRSANRERLARRDVTVVWLDASPAFLASRIERKAHRPLLAGDATPREVLERLHGERAALYDEVADLVVAVEPFHRNEDKPKAALADRIAELVLEREGDSVAAGGPR
jgi:shikimate kinase